MAEASNALGNDPRYSPSKTEEIENAIREMLSRSTGSRRSEDGDGRALPADRRQPSAGTRKRCCGCWLAAIQQDIAIKYGLSAKTIETYKMRSLTKLGLTGRPDVTCFALEHGWFDGPSAEAPA